MTRPPCHPANHSSSILRIWRHLHEHKLHNRLPCHPPRDLRRRHHLHARTYLFRSLCWSATPLRILRHQARFKCQVRVWCRLSSSLCIPHHFQKQAPQWTTDLILKPLFLKTQVAQNPRNELFCCSMPALVGFGQLRFWLSYTHWTFTPRQVFSKKPQFKCALTGSTRTSCSVSSLSLHEQ